MTFVEWIDSLFENKPEKKEPAVLENDLDKLNFLINRGYVVHIHMYPRKQYSVTVVSDNMEFKAQFFDSLEEALDNIFEKLLDLGLISETDLIL